MVLAWFSFAPETVTAPLKLAKLPPLDHGLAFGLDFLLFYYFVWLLFSALLIGTSSQTIGARLCSIKVADVYGSAPGFLQSILRAMAQTTTLLTGGLGMLCAGGHKRQTLHDRLAGTFVVTAP